MENDEEIRAHVVSIWRESKKFLSIGGREGMLVLTDKHLSFIHKTTAKIKWWKAITQRQALIFMKSKDTMIHHDGYDEKDLVIPYQIVNPNLSYYSPRFSHHWIFAFQISHCRRKCIINMVMTS